VEYLRDAGRSSNTLARETTDLCQLTFTKSDKMVEFRSDLKDTLDTIQDLLSGEKAQTVMGLAKEISDHAKACVEKSMEMVSFCSTSKEKG
jgi:hypothetical protein